MLPDGCVRHGCLLVCSLGTLALEGTLLLELTLTTICLGLDGASSFTSRLATMDPTRSQARQAKLFEGRDAATKKLPPRSGGLWYSRWGWKTPSHLYPLTKREGTLGLEAGL